ncbi:hypothetical protein GCM10027089_28350 [Nocardia thraciensis]
MGLRSFRLPIRYRRGDEARHSGKGTAMGDIPALLATLFDIPRWVGYIATGSADS